MAVENFKLPPHVAGSDLQRPSPWILPLQGTTPDDKHLSPKTRCTNITTKLICLSINIKYINIQLQIFLSV